jgi:hypothetical protein
VTLQSSREYEEIRTKVNKQNKDRVFFIHRNNGVVLSSINLAAPFNLMKIKVAAIAMLAQLNYGNKVVLTYTCNRVAPTT